MPSKQPSYAKCLFLKLFKLATDRFRSEAKAGPDVHLLWGSAGSFVKFSQ